jgi:anthranilate synthase component 2
LIAVVDNFDSFTYNLVHYIEVYDEVIVMRNNAINEQVLHQSKGIVLSPGPGLPHEAGDLLKVIESYYLSKKMLGVCLGHQALAEFFGIHLIQTGHVYHGLKRKTIQTKPCALWHNIPKEFYCGRYHSWVVKQFIQNENITSCAEDENGLIMAIAHKNLPIFGIQFHPESIMTDFGKQIIKNWLDV